MEHSQRSSLQLNPDAFPYFTLGTICADQVRGSNHLFMIVHISESSSDALVVFPKRYKFVTKVSRNQGFGEAFFLQECFQHYLRATLTRLGRL